MKTIFTTLLLSVLAFAAMAQPLKIGVRGGLTTGDYKFTKLNVGDSQISPGARPTPGYQVALALRLSIPHFIQIQPELAYSTRNYTYRVSSPGMADNVKVQNKALEVPVMVGFNIKAFRLFGGPVFNLSEKQRIKGDRQGLQVKYDKKEMALQFGAGFDIRKFFVDVRYTTYTKGMDTSFTLHDAKGSVKSRHDSHWTFSMGFFF